MCRQGASLSAAFLWRARVCLVLPCLTCMYLLTILILPFALWPILLLDSSSLPFLFYKEKRRWEGDFDMMALIAILGLVWSGQWVWTNNWCLGSEMVWCGGIGRYFGVSYLLGGRNGMCCVSGRVVALLSHRFLAALLLQPFISNILHPSPATLSPVLRLIPLSRSTEPLFAERHPSPVPPCKSTLEAASALNH